MPFPGEEANREKLETWLRKRYAASAFNTCPHQQLQEMTGKPLDIVFVEGLYRSRYTRLSAFPTTGRRR